MRVDALTIVPFSLQAKFRGNVPRMNSENCFVELKRRNDYKVTIAQAGCRVLRPPAQKFR
jgi:hypothetical protein